MCQDWWLEKIKGRLDEMDRHIGNLEVKSHSSDLRFDQIERKLDRIIETIREQDREFNNFITGMLILGPVLFAFVLALMAKS
jgi:hypothetical protein